jgi:dTDP-glucose pyrophosphorylase/CBS domain-containing protein
VERLDYEFLAIFQIYNIMNIKKITMLKDESISKALKLIDKGGIRIALVVDERNTLLGTLSDGDIRRGLLKDKDVNSSILDLYNKKPIVAIAGTSENELNNISKASEDQVDQIPLIDSNGKLVDIHFVKKPQYRDKFSNTVVLMVGGLGSRLKPLTDNTPKPMLHVGGKPILETIIERFRVSGFKNIIMCVGYKSSIIQNFFQDGKNFGVEIEYIVESKRMGTAGAIGLIEKKLNKPFFVMNGDLLADIKFNEVLDYHIKNDSTATMCIREYDLEVPFGVVSVNNECISMIEEKPIQSFNVNAGVYLLNPSCVNLIPKNEFYNITSLFQELIKSREKVISYPLKDYWLDIGKLSDYEKANFDYHNIF